MSFYVCLCKGRNAFHWPRTVCVSALRLGPYAINLEHALTQYLMHTTSLRPQLASFLLRSQAES